MAAIKKDMERHVALKLLTYAPSSDPEQFQRFEREAKVVSRLTHPHYIVRFFSYGAWEG
jgi:serine/threonine protein kinase